MEKLTNLSLKRIAFFETMTRTTVKDFFTHNGTMFFVVKEGQAGRAIGAHGATIKRLTALFHANLRVLEFNPDPATFVRNLVAPVQPDAVTVEAGRIVLVARESSVRSRLIGRNKANVHFFSTLVEKYFHRTLVVVGRVDNEQRSP